MTHLSHDQITLVFETIFEMRPRAADLTVLSVMGADPETVADYIWDHMLGEPDSPTRDEVLARVQIIIATSQGDLK